MGNLGNQPKRRMLPFVKYSENVGLGKTTLCDWVTPWDGPTLLHKAHSGIRVCTQDPGLPPSSVQLPRVPAIAVHLPRSENGRSAFPSCLHTTICGSRTRVTGGLSLPAAPAMCSSMLSRSSQAAGWMSPYISSVRTGAALISRDKGAGDRLITWGKTEIMASPF